MDITLTQGLLIALIAGIIGIDYWLEALFLFRPIIVSTIVGIILGDVKLGLATGAITELAFAGLTPAGGTQPPNPVLAGIMCTVLAFTTGKGAAAALVLAYPFSLLMQYIILFFYSTFSFSMRRADEAVSKADIKALGKINIMLTLIVAAVYAIVAFVSAYVAQDFVKSLVESMPEWLIHGFEVTGGILPAIGFGMLLRVMMKLEYIPYLIVGFMLATYGKFDNLLPVALLGTALAIYTYFNEKKSVTITEDKQDGI